MCPVLFGNLSLVRAPTSSLRTKALWMASYLPGYPVNASENDDFNLGCESYPVYSFIKVMDLEEL